MEKKYRIAMAVMLILCIAIGRICYYTLPVELPYLEEIEQCSQVKLKTFYHSQGAAKSTEERILTKEEILELQDFLESSTFSRKHTKDQISMDYDKSLHITFTWSDGRHVQLRTFGDNTDRKDIFVWDSDDLRFLKAHDENWHNTLENLLINEESHPLGRGS